jgi:L-fuconolactonase
MKLPEGLVDAHVHYWDPIILPYGWLKGLPFLDRPFVPQDYSAVSAQAGVVKIVFVESGCDPSRALDEVDWVVSLALHEPRIRAVVANAPVELGGGVRDHLMRLAERPLVKGVRRLLQGEREVDYCLSPGFIEGVRLLKGFGFSMDLCIRHEQLAPATELAAKVPGVHFILDHFGKPPVKQGALEPWRSQLRELAGLPNVSCKVSGLTTEADWERWTAADLKPYFDAVIESFGPDRVIFGGDWPVCTLATEYQRWVGAVAELTSSLSAEDSAKLFRSNAERIYRI